MTENERRASGKCRIEGKFHGDVLDSLEKIKPDVPEEDVRPFVTDMPDGVWALTVRFFITRFNERVRREDREDVLSELASFITDAFSVDAKVSPVAAVDIFDSDDDPFTPKLVFGLNPRPGLSLAGAVRMLSKLDSLGTLVLKTCNNRFSGQFTHSIECKKSRGGFTVIDFDNTGGNVAEKIMKAVRYFGESEGRYSYGVLRKMCFCLCGIDDSVSSEADFALMKVLEKNDARRRGRKGSIVNRN